MKEHQRSVVCRAGILLVLALLFSPGCKKRPVELGMADMQALGAGIGRALCAFLSTGDTVLVFGTPGAIGYGAGVETDSVSGMNRTLAVCGSKAVPISYTAEEIRAYHAHQSDGLDAEYAAPAFARARDQSCRAVVSLGGPPSGGFLPADAVLVLVSWSPGAGTPDAKGFRAVVHVKALSAEGLHPPPNKSLHKDVAAALAWFDQRFTTEVVMP